MIAKIISKNKYSLSDEIAQFVRKNVPNNKNSSEKVLDVALIRPKKCIFVFSF
jgi:hypothetical protein